MARIFLTGATGYIGGDALHALYRAHPEYQISALVRDPAKSADVFAKEYPNVRIVQGSLDDGDLVADEAAKADVVLNLAATSHLPSVKSIHQGLKKASTSRSGKPAHWLQISGATVLACGEIASKTFGEPPDKVYHDLDSGEIWAQVKKYPSRAVVNYIHDVATQDAGTVNTALLVGPIIFGAGRGPGNRRSIQIPELARTAIERRRAWQVGRGLSVWDHVHVRDLSGITLRLVERAVAGGSDQSGLWGEDGVYFAGVGHLIFIVVRSADLGPLLLTQAFADISRRIAAAAYALGLADSPDAVDALPPAEADKLVGHASILLGTNARCDARRAVEKLGWSPKEQSLELAIEETVRDEAGKVGKAGL
ncbi:Mannosyltransferase 1 CMT1 [Lasiodiplodia theobromae]|uniref:Mannosyltransferase 1 CMT1 n=1 Tax=Lasiodiplodia theobromae TaxID=45133 RepID=A0A8H7M7V0_9PEZI|nr:Mannosyltransferase 1 CMT1 [Lasiodiplodia theobromae]